MMFLRWKIFSLSLSLSLSAAGAPKKSKQERIEERKAKRREEELKDKGQEESNDPVAMTAEEKLEEKRKAEEAQRQADLESAKELFGGMIGILDDPFGNRGI